jgi:purine-binding chemotaxis protein CheW
MMHEVKETPEQTQYLTFHLGGHEYAIDILQIREIVEYEGVTKMPGMPACVRGVIDLRGSAVPLVDLVVAFGLAETPVTRETCILIVEAEVTEGRTLVGIVVEDVCDVVGLPPGEIEPPPRLGAPLRADALKGLAKIREKFIPILDVNQILGSREIMEAASIRSPDAPPDPQAESRAAPEEDGPVS